MKRICQSLSVLVLMLLALACVGSARAQVSRFAYVLDSGGQGTISVYTINQVTGQLRSNGYALVGSLSFPVSMTLAPSGKFAFVADVGIDSVSAFKINATTGKLTQVTGSPFATGENPVAVAVDPSGQFAYVANILSDNISAYKIESNGALKPVAGSPFAAGLAPNSVAIDPSGKFLYASNEDDSPGGDVSAYTIDSSTGALTPIPGSPFLPRSGGFALTLAPSGEFGYVGSGDGAQITAFSINRTTGVPTVVAGSPFVQAGASGSYTIVVDPASQFLYALGGTEGNNIAAFSINGSTGALTSIAGSPFATGTDPSAATVDPNDKLLYVTNEGTNEVWTYTIADNGALTFLNTARTQQGPSSVALGVGTASITYTPKFAYVANGNGSANNVSAYKINATTGKLKAVTGSPFASGSLPVSVTVDPSGRFAYVANENGGSVSAYTINSGSGVLTQISGSPFPAGNGPNSVTVDPSGKFAYVVNGANGGNGTPGPSISAYTINTSTGALTAVSGSPYPTGANSAPGQATVDPTGEFFYVADRSNNGGNGNILAYAINFSTGALNAVNGSPFTAGVDNPAAVAVDPSGRFLFLTNVPGGDGVEGYISVYNINPTLGLQGSAGALSEIASSPFATGIFPVSVQVDPLGSFVYVTSASIFTSDNVYGYALDATSGALTNLTGSPFSSGEAGAPNGMAVDPSGRFAYVANNALDNITAFAIAASSGDLSIISGDSAVPAGTNPVSVITTGTIQ